MLKEATYFVYSVLSKHPSAAICGVTAKVQAGCTQSCCLFPAAIARYLHVRMSWKQMISPAEGTIRGNRAYVHCCVTMRLLQQIVHSGPIFSRLRSCPQIGVDWTNSIQFRVNDLLQRQQFNSRIRRGSFQRINGKEQLRQ